MAYWLFKSEPNCFSFADLLAAPDRTTGWDGVRNFQARNFLRDAVPGRRRRPLLPLERRPAGDRRGRRGGPARATPTRPRSTPRPSTTTRRATRPSPTWYQVSIRAVRAIDPPLGLPVLRTVPALAGMELLRKGSRLSVQPVSAAEWDAVLEAGRRLAPPIEPTPTE